MSEEVTKEQLVGQLRFALQSMGEKNEHHRFEDLCRAFARERIAPNILPATGPVGAGGDQGRDFETFRSHLRDELGPHGAFAGSLPDGPLAFTCTLQEDGLPTKIRADLGKIVAEGTTVVGVYAFCVAGLPVGRRHELQNEAREEHGVEAPDLRRTRHRREPRRPRAFLDRRRVPLDPRRLSPVRPGA